MASIQRKGFTPNQNQLSNVFRALGHPARLAIIDLLIENEPIICKEIQNYIPLSTTTITRHIQVLFDNGLLGYEKIRNQTYYVLNPIVVDTIAVYLGKTLTKNEKHETNYRNIHFRSQLMF